MDLSKIFNNEHLTIVGDTFLSVKWCISQDPVFFLGQFYDIAKLAIIQKKLDKFGYRL